jgi:hypothetical protein
MKDPLDGDRTADLYPDPIIPGEAGATVESEDEKRRRIAREKKQKQRAAAKQKKQALNTESEQEWFQQNRARLKPDELTATQEKDAYVRDLLFSMKTLKGQDEELVQIVVEFVEERGVAHLGRITKAGPETIPADWPSRPYWQQPELLAALEGEGWQTAQYVRLGLLAALPDFRVEQFLTQKVGWSWERAISLLGQRVSSRDIVSYP